MECLLWAWNSACPAGPLAEGRQVPGSRHWLCGWLGGDPELPPTSLGARKDLGGVTSHLSLLVAGGHGVFRLGPRGARAELHPRSLPAPKLTLPPSWVEFIAPTFQEGCSATPGCHKMVCVCRNRGHGRAACPALRQDLCHWPGGNITWLSIAHGGHQLLAEDPGGVRGSVQVLSRESAPSSGWLQLFLWLCCLQPSTGAAANRRES